MEYKDLKELTELHNKLETEKQISFSKESIRILGLSVGDSVKASFHVSRLSGKESYSYISVEDGIIKQYENGIIYIESVKKLPHSFSRSNNRTGRDRRSWWEIELQHMKVQITNIKIPVSA